MVDASDLEPFPKLTQISFSNNQLVSLDENLFMHTPKLEVIYFTFNLLQHVGYNLMTDLTELTYADFEWNPCVDFHANTTKLIQELFEILKIQCPPLDSTTTLTSTTEDDDCPIRCSVNEEIDELTRRSNEQEKTITRMMKMIEELQEQISELK